MEPATNNIKNTIGNIVENIPTPKQVGENITQGVSQGVNTISNTINAAKEGVSQTINQFSSPAETMTTSTEFLTSNSIIAKFVFVILVVIVFFFLVNLSIKIIGYFSQPSKNPYVIYGLVNGNSNINISQNPQDPNSVVILRSNNESKGLEASWSFWLNINKINPLKTGATKEKPSFSHIFNKGDTTFVKDIENKKNIGVASVNNAPGLYISDNDNTLRVYMDTVTNNNNYLEVSNIPLNKWFHCAIRIQNMVMDVYINGVITARKVLTEVPKQNYNSVNVGNNMGFSGQLSNLCYYSHALSIFEINNIILMGPNMRQSNSVITNTNYFGYLSNIWYSSKL
jgi:hypothetical protein